MAELMTVLSREKVQETRCALNPTWLLSIEPQPLLSQGFDLHALVKMREAVMHAFAALDLNANILKLAQPQSMLCFFHPYCPSHDAAAAKM